MLPIRLLRGSYVLLSACLLAALPVSVARAEESKACKADLTADGVVNFADLAFLKSVFFQRCDDPGPIYAFPATGQTTCWNSPGLVIACAGTGHDGDTRAGAALAYQDNGDGTITDLNTGLMWEKLDDNNVGGIHDKDNTYTWDNAFAVKVATLNGGGGFAGHTDWRVPNIKELQSIVNYDEIPYAGPTVSAAFNSSCTAGCTVTSCSCTQSGYYWSSSSYATTPLYAWFVNFNYGNVNVNLKTNDSYVRAVRGGP